MIASPLRHQFCVLSCMLLLVVAGVSGCGTETDPDNSGGVKPPPADGSLQFLSIGTAPIGGTFPIVGDAIAQTLNTHKGENNWKAQAKGTKGSQETCSLRSPTRRSPTSRVVVNLPGTRSTT